MASYSKQGGLQVAQDLFHFVEDEVLPELDDIDSKTYWSNLESLLDEFAPRNRALLAKRDDLQAKIDDYHKKAGNDSLDPKAYESFLRDIAYLQPSVEPFQIETDGVDNEISSIAGPQLVVPIMNARFALNAVNARWGSLFDALYGTDLIEQKSDKTSKVYDPARGELVIQKAAAILDDILPLEAAPNHAHVVRYCLKDGDFVAKMRNGQLVGLKAREQYIGFKGSQDTPTSLLFRNNSLHVEIQIDQNSPIGRAHPASVKDIVLESAVTTIQDCEDSVAAVDAADKTLVYRNWLGLMRGDLSTTFSKNGKLITRKMVEDRIYTDRHGKQLALPGRSLLLIRNVGHLMTNDAVILSDGTEAPEGILDAYFTSTIAKFDLDGKTTRKNSRSGSVYIVKPKMHGPEEVAFTVSMFTAIEQYLGMPPRTLKIGIMDEERRTTLNLRRCIFEAKDRVIFINTGFLDRTGDEIHTSMLAGPVVRKAAMKQQDWIRAYEEWNVDQGLATGFQCRAQIGKGMWAMPDEMAKMMKDKISHLMAGANCAWVPSPTAATLHAIHYHKINVADRQLSLLGRQGASLESLLSIPLLHGEKLSSDEITEELKNNAQGILGYVVRWIDQGIGCSKVPDIHNIGLMEDRATLRISSQHIANWIHHGLCSPEQVRKVLERMAAAVDKQNSHVNKNYQPMAPNFDQSVAFQAACDLIFQGIQQPNGYTEPILHARRREAKAKQKQNNN
mmetsp:Transcript_20084/g.29801  ORF Transcript_20084/g.29801 Transcript_20084/m.29801 type:complete len:731 (+) Transcript_20084:76-2268(+)